MEKILQRWKATIRVGGGRPIPKIPLRRAVLHAFKQRKKNEEELRKEFLKFFEGLLSSFSAWDEQCDCKECSEQNQFQDLLIKTIWALKSK